MTKLTKIQGGAELQKLLDSLAPNIERNILRSALRQGANVIRDEAKKNVSDRTGELSKSIKVKTRSRRGNVTAQVVTDKYYARFVEYGTESHFIKSKDVKSLFFAGIARQVVEHPGAKPHPFMRPAIDAKQNEAIRAVGEQIRKRLEKVGVQGSQGLEVDDE